MCGSPKSQIIAHFHTLIIILFCVQYVCLKHIYLSLRFLISGFIESETLEEIPFAIIVIKYCAVHWLIEYNDILDQEVRSP